MNSTAQPAPVVSFARRRLRIGDTLLRWVTGLAALGSLVLVGLIAFKVWDQARLAIEKFGLGFLTATTWNPVTRVFGAGTFIFGTALTSLVALAIAGPVSIAIALFLTELAPKTIRGPIAGLVELLAAVPSVVLGLWGIFVLGPFVGHDIEPWLSKHLGWIPLFSGTPSIVGMLPAILILTIMIVPIVTSICRELFRAVPNDLKEGALALGMTRWEMIRGVVIPHTRAGIAAALILGLGRAVGEAIAVTQVIGGTVNISWSLFSSADTLASRIAAQYQAADTFIQTSAIAYLAVILLVFSLIANLIARVIVLRFERLQGAGR